jgi:cytoskeleton protein RodZ
MDGASDGDAEPAAGLVSAGEVLRRQREALGLELYDVATVLRIKPRYLAALEEGRPDELPGPSYALGFMRSYADYLGLDADEVLRRLKQGPPRLAAKPDLSFPIAREDRAIPGGGTLITAAILAVCGYGAWYFSSTGPESRAERVAPVPAELLLHTISSQPKQAPSAPPSSGNTPSSAYPIGAGSDTATPAIAPPAAGSAPPVPMPGSAQISRGIIVHATANSWIEIRDARRSVVVARVLKAGQIYRVPDQPGLSMRTGNAGGLEITCDGNPVPSIGGTGVVRRDIALDPQALTTGRAVRN